MGFEAKIVLLRNIRDRARGVTAQVSVATAESKSETELMLVRNLTEWGAIIDGIRRDQGNKQALTEFLHTQARGTDHAFNAGQRVKSGAANIGKIEAAVKEVFDEVRKLYIAFYKPDSFEVTAMKTLSDILERMMKPSEEVQIVTVSEVEVTPSIQQLQQHGPAPVGPVLNAPGPIDAVMLLAMFITMMVAKLNKKT